MEKYKAEEAKVLARSVVSRCSDRSQRRKKGIDPERGDRIAGLECFQVQRIQFPAKQRYAAGASRREKEVKQQTRMDVIEKNDENNAGKWKDGRAQQLVD